MNNKSFASAQEIHNFERTTIDRCGAVIAARFAAITISIEMSNADLYRAAIADNDYEIVRQLTSMEVEVKRDLDKLVARPDDSMSIRQYSDTARDIAHVRTRLIKLRNVLEDVKTISRTAAAIMPTSFLIERMESLIVPATT